MTIEQEENKEHYEYLDEASSKATNAIMALEAFSPKDRALKKLYTAQRKAILTVLKKIHKDSQREIQKIRSNCQHDMYYAGHSHNDDCYECLICGQTDWR